MTRVDRVDAAVPEAYGSKALPVPESIHDGRASRREVERSSPTHACCLTREDPRGATDPWSQDRVGWEEARQREELARDRTPVVPPGTWLPWVAGPYPSFSGHETYFDIAAPWLLYANPVEALFASRASSPADVRLPFGAPQRLARCVQDCSQAWRSGSGGLPLLVPDPDLSDLVVRLVAARARWWRPW